jgi:hypothetical protein
MAFPTPAPWMTGTVNQKLLRMMTGAALGRPLATFAGGVSPTTGGGSHGVVGMDDLKVTVQSGLTMAIAVGSCFINGTSSIDQGTYFAYNGATQTIALNAHNTQARTDLIIVRAQDNAEDASGATQLIHDKVTGTPGSGVPSPPAGSLVLAECAVPANSGTVVITDRRRYATALGGAHRCTSTSRPTGVALYEGQEIHELDTDRRLVNVSATTTADWRLLWEGAGGWIALTPGSGWANYGAGYHTLHYRKTTWDTVEVRGTVQRSSGSDATIGILPVGYRPAFTYQVVARDDVGFCYVQYEPDGDIVYTGSGVNPFAVSLNHTIHTT